MALRATGTTHDICVDIAAVLHPIPSPIEEDDWGPPTGQVWEEREEGARQLRPAWEEGGSDPLLSTLESLRTQRLRLEADMRLLIAYARRFTHLRPYKLIDLAEAAGMSISGVPMAYDNEELGQPTELLGRRFRRPPGMPADLEKSEHRGTATVPVLREDLSPHPRRSATHGPAGLPPTGPAACPPVPGWAWLASALATAATQAPGCARAGPALCPDPRPPRTAAPAAGDSCGQHAPMSNTALQSAAATAHARSRPDLGGGLVIRPVLGGSPN